MSDILDRIVATTPEDRGRGVEPPDVSLDPDFENPSH